MIFTQIEIFTTFTIVLILFIMSLRNTLFVELSTTVRFILLLACGIPVWGIVLAFFGIVYLIHDIKKAKRLKKRIMNNSYINRLLFGEDICYK